MPKTTIKFESYGSRTMTDILLNGEKVGELSSGGGMVYVLMKNADGKMESVARFKYMKPKTKAKHWAKFILGHLSPTQIIEQVKYPETPLGLAQKLGYVSI